MTHIRFAVLLTCCAGVALPSAPGAVAQPVAPRSAEAAADVGIEGAPPISVVDPTSAPAGTAQRDSTARPEWLLWRVFHDSLRFYRNQSPEKIRFFLVQRIGVTEREVDIVLNAGDAYLGQLAAIDDEGRREVAARYRPARPPPLAELPVPQGRQDLAGLDTSKLIGAQGRDGHKLYETLKQDGFIARVEIRREAVAKAHVDRLREALGPVKLDKLEVLLRTDVAPGVVVSAR